MKSSAEKSGERRDLIESDRVEELREYDCQ